MTNITDRYATAVRSGNLRSKPDTTASDSDVLGAAGLAAKRAPLAMALLRLFMADNGGAAEVVAILTESIKTRAYRAHRLTLSDLECADIARAVLAWHRDGICPTCKGHGYKLAGSVSFGEGRAVLSDAACDDCRGTRKVPFDSQFPMEFVMLARWVREEIEREQAYAGSAAMAALAPKLDLGG